MNKFGNSKNGHLKRLANLHTIMLLSVTIAFSSCAPPSPNQLIPTGYKQISSDEILNLYKGKMIEAVRNGHRVPETAMVIGIGGTLEISTGLGMSAVRYYRMQNNMLCEYQSKYYVTPNMCFIFLQYANGKISYARIPMREANKDKSLYLFEVRVIEGER